MARRGTALGEVKFAAGNASGKVTAEGGSQSYTATPAKGYAGLYRTTTGPASKPGSTETGWVVLPDGDVCGNTNSVTAGGGFKSEPAPSQPEGSGKVSDFANPFSF